MAVDLLGSGYATLQYEIAEERASALGRLGRRLEAALAALAACPRTATSERTIRDSLVEQAGYALWLFVVQREAYGLNDSTHVMQTHRGASRGLCPHGAIGHAQQPCDEDGRALIAAAMGLSSGSRPSSGCKSG